MNVNIASKLFADEPVTGEKQTLLADVKIIDGHACIVLPKSIDIGYLRESKKENSNTVYISVATKPVDLVITQDIADETGKVTKRERVMTTKPVSVNLFLKLG